MSKTLQGHRTELN